MTIDELIAKLERLKNTQVGIHGDTDVWGCIELRDGGVSDDHQISDIDDAQAENGYRFVRIQIGAE